VNRSTPPHRDDRATALRHFNAAFRHRYALPALTAAWLETVDGLTERWADIAAIRADGVRDASCALLARVALSITPRYAIGFLDGNDRAHVQAPTTGDAGAFRSHHVLLVNPLGGYDNWAEVARWVRQSGGERARRMLLAGLASEQRPDYEEIDRRLRSEPEPRPAIVLPPDEAFSAALAAEVSFIYDLPIETLRAWKQRYRAERAAKRSGRPRNR
jgi:hypothetical protein